MGCGGSVALPDSLPNICGIKMDVELTYEQKYLIRETWKFLEVSKKEIGVKIYKRFLNMHPYLKVHFNEFKDIKIDEINGSHGHPRRLLQAIDNAVTSLGDSDSFSAYLIELGRRHNNHGFKPGGTHFNDLRKCFLSVIQEILEAAHLWDSQVDGAWNGLFDSITAMMLKGIQLGANTS